MRTKGIKGGLNFEGQRQRALFVSRGVTDGHREHDHQSAFFDWLKWNERRHTVLKYFFAIPNGGYRHKTTAMKLRAEGVKPGVLDTCLPVPRNGHAGLWIEFKAGRNTLTDYQSDWKAFLESEGHRVEVCYCWQEAALATVRYLELADYTSIAAR